MSTKHINASDFDERALGVLELVSETDLADVTREELDAFDPSTFDTGGIEFPDDITDSSRLFDRLDAIEDVAEPVAPTRRANLFGDIDEKDQERGGGYDFFVSTPRVSELVPMVVRAYINIRDGASTDRVVADPEFNLLFLQECWKLGIAASPKELNWVLFNARKDGVLKGIPPATSYSIPKKKLDEFSFASEIALRHMQDQAFLSQQRDLSLDKVLCDPHLVKQFDEVAQLLKPGYSSLDYRWAAISLRKARKPNIDLEAPTFHPVGAVDRIQVRHVPKEPGVFCLRSDARTGFVGVAENLRLQIDHLLGSMGPNLVPEWMGGKPFGVAHLHLLPMPKTGTRTREQFRCATLKANGSRLNFLKGSLFHRVA